MCVCVADQDALARPLCSSRATRARVVAKSTAAARTTARTTEQRGKRAGSEREGGQFTTQGPPKAWLALLSARAQRGPRRPGPPLAVARLVARAQGALQREQGSQASRMITDGEQPEQLRTRWCAQTCWRVRPHRATGRLPGCQAPWCPLCGPRSSLPGLTHLLWPRPRPPGPRATRPGRSCCRSCCSCLLLSCSHSSRALVRAARALVPLLRSCPHSMCVYPHMCDGEAVQRSSACQVSLVKCDQSVHHAGTAPGRPGPPLDREARRSATPAAMATAELRAILAALGGASAPPDVHLHCQHAVEVVEAHALSVQDLQQAGALQPLLALLQHKVRAIHGRCFPHEVLLPGAAAPRGGLLAHCPRPHRRRRTRCRSARP